MNRYLLLTIIVSALLTVNSNSVGQKSKMKKTLTWSEDSVGTQQSQVSVNENLISFEEKEVPSNWSVDENGQLSISKRHYKHGKSSLEWVWEGTSTLTATNLPNLTETAQSKRGGILMWIYNETPLKGNLVFEFYDKLNEKKFQFQYGANFKGWRNSWIKFEEDVQYTPNSKDEITTLKIQAPQTSEGKIYLDLWEFSTRVQSNRSSSYQFQRGTPEKHAWATYKWSLYEPYLPLLKRITQQNINAFKKIEDRLNFWLFGTDKYKDTEAYKIRKEALNNFINRGVKEFDKYNIKRHSDGNITGVPIFSRNSPYKPKISEDISQKVCLALAYDYKINGNKKSLDKMLLLYDYLHDQGWAEGSSLGSLDHETSRSIGYIFSVYTLHNELKEAGILEREIATIDWFMNFKCVFVQEKLETTADAMRNKYMAYILRVLMMEDTPQKVQYMGCLINYLSAGLEIGQGWADVIKPDYTGYHHRDVYGNGYATNAYLSASIINYLLHDTPFSLEKQSVENLKNALRTQRIMSNKYHTPASIGGRLQSHDVLNRIIASYAYLAYSQPTINKEMAGIFMRLWDPESNYLKKTLFPNAGTGIPYFHTLGEIEIMMDLANEGIAPEKAPNGFWSKPFAGLAVHRQGEWLVTAKGWSQYIYDFESGAKENLYGRYISYGSVQIQSTGNPIDYISTGYALQQGWDWTHWPGTTAIGQALENIKCTKKDGLKHRNFSPSTFLGATTCDNENGVWSMQLIDSVYEIGFTANKSVFFFGNEIICLGSDINNNNDLYSTETTLFQTFIQSSSEPTYISSNKKITEFPYEETLRSKKNTWLMDSKNNAYIIPKGQNIEIKRQHQNSKHPNTAIETEGDYAIAWLNHGTSPKKEEYEYTILINSTPDKAYEYTQNIPYKVIAKNNTAHILQHNNYNAIAYAVFDPNNYKSFGLVKNISAPVLIMYKEEENDAVLLSLTDPDFRRSHLTTTAQANDLEDIFERGETMLVTLTLKGKWQAVQKPEQVKTVNVINNETIIVFNCHNAETYQLQLKKM